MRTRLMYMGMVLLGVLFAACEKDESKTEGFIKVYNDFVIFGKTRKTADHGFLVITTDNVNDNKRFAVKVNDRGEKDWQVFLDYNSPDESSRTVVKNFVNIAETPDNMALVLVEVLDPLGVGMPPVLKFIKVNADGASVDSATVINPFLNTGLTNLSFSKFLVTPANGGYVVSLVGISSEGSLKGVATVQYQLGSNYNVSNGDLPIASSAHKYYISGFSSTFSTDLMQLKRTNDNGFIVLAPGNTNSHNGFILKLNNSLNEQWRYYHRSGAQAKQLIDAVEMPGNRLMVLGQAGYLDKGTNRNDDDFLVMIVDNANGDVLKEVRYRDMDNSGNSIKADANVARAITPLSNGNFLLVGDQSDYAQNGAIDSHTEGTNLYMLEITGDAGAEPVRRVVIESSFGLHGNDILELNSGRFLALCSKHSFGFMQYRDMVLMEIFPDGNFVE